jgi:hypothetical protein
MPTVKLSNKAYQRVLKNSKGRNKKEIASSLILNGKVNVTTIKEQKNKEQLKRDEKFYCWLAGFADGDGSIGIRRNTLPKQKFAYKPYLSLSQKDRSVLDFVKSHIGGCVVQDKYKNINHHHFFIYDHNRLLKILPRLIPYLQVKRKQAELMLEYFDRCPYNDNKCYELRGEYFKRFMLLNTNGNGDKGSRYLEFERKLRRNSMPEESYMNKPYCLENR